MVWVLDVVIAVMVVVVGVVVGLCLWVMAQMNQAIAHMTQGGGR